MNLGVIRKADAEADRFIREARARDTLKARRQLEQRAMRVSEVSLLHAEEDLTQIEAVLNDYAQVVSELEQRRIPQLRILTLRTPHSGRSLAP